MSTLVIHGSTVLLPQNPHTNSVINFIALSSEDAMYEALRVESHASINKLSKKWCWYSELSQKVIIASTDPTKANTFFFSNYLATLVHMF